MLQVGLDDVVVGAVEGGAVLQQGLLDAVHVHTGNCGQLGLHCWGKERKKSPLLAHPERLTDYLTAKHEYTKAQPHLLPTLPNEEFKAAKSLSRFPLHTLGLRRDPSVLAFQTSSVWDAELLRDYLKLRQKVAGHCCLPLGLCPAPQCHPWNENFISFMLFRLQPP